MRRIANAGQLKQLRRVDRAARQQHLLMRAEHFLAATAKELDADRAARSTITRVAKALVMILRFFRSFTGCR